jgi:hypothetical protein
VQKAILTLLMQDGSVKRSGQLSAFSGQQARSFAG